MLISNGRVLAGSATLLLLPKADAVIACLTNTASEATDDLSFQLADLFSSGLLANFDALRKEIEAAEASTPFRADPAQLGAWTGTVETPNGKLPVRIQISADNQMQIGFAPGGAAAKETDPVKMVPVKELGIEEGFLSGEAATSLSLPKPAISPQRYNCTCYGSTRTA